MFGSYNERTDVAAKMNIFQTIALVLGAALPPMLANFLGWSGMAVLLACISAIAIYLGYPAMYERQELKTDTSFPSGRDVYRHERFYHHTERFFGFDSIRIDDARLRL